MSSSSTATEILNSATRYSMYRGYILFPFGITGNALNVLVFTQLKLFRDNRCAFYLTVESISSCVNQLINLILAIFTSIYGDDGTGHFLVWCKLRYIFGQISTLTTYYMICCAAVDQFFSTNHHYNLRQICTLKLTRCFTFTLVCLSIIHAIIFGLYFDIQPSVGCVILDQRFLQYAIFFVYPVLIGLLPIVIASFFSLLAFQNVRRIVRRQLPIVRRRLDRQMTAMVLLHVVFFVCLAFTFSVYRIYAVNFPISQSQPMVFAVRQLVQAICNSFSTLIYTVSFYVFMISSSRFRRQVKLVLVKKCWQRWKHWCCCFNNNQIGPANAESDGTNMELEENI